MERLIAERISSEERDIIDNLSLRWGDKQSIRNVNLVNEIFGKPNIIDQGLRGLACWRGIKILEYVIELWIKDQESDIVTIIWKMKERPNIEFLTPNVGLIGNSYVITTETFRDAISIFSIVIDLSKGKSFIQSMKTYNVIQMLNEDKFKSLFTIPSKKTSPSTHVNIELPRIVPRKISPAMVERPYKEHPVYIRESDSSLPTLINATHTSTIERLKDRSSVRSPSGKPVLNTYLHQQQ